MKNCMSVIVFFNIKKLFLDYFILLIVFIFEGFFSKNEFMLIVTILNNVDFFGY